MDNPKIVKLLVCSTSHITLNVSRHLGKEDGLFPAYEFLDPLVWDSVEYGWLIRHWKDRNNEQTEFNWSTFPVCLKELIKKAEDLGCTMILLDCDAAEIEGLRTYDW